ncbi:hypothetical protein BDN70DRAFT_935189 [Pholiota conissans]|uniref:Uncharacterized protein n=1 Tax=Pholiota conissans TaxID=109636 RepID=A0A9P6CX52_9AGAR|nr:hypothetical protein BDN70DRAFT_935189 [Pholiota conissans]
MSDTNSTTLHEKIVQAGLTVYDEKSMIAASLNSSIFLALLMGMYTVIFGGTMYAYSIRQPSKRHLVPITVSLLYISNLATFVIQWFSTKLQFVDNGATRETILLDTFGGQFTIAVLLSVLNVISFVLGDALLIWRCFNLWNRSIRVISVPVLLTIIGTAQTIGFSITPSLQPVLNKVVAAGILLSGCTTIITTVLIIYRIYSFSKQKHISSTKFRHIIDIVVQSGAVYAISLLIFGVSGMLSGQSFVNLKVPTYNFGLWTTAFVLPIAGISTTVMVARVATLSENTRSVYVSEIQFQQTTIHPGTGTHASSVPYDAGLPAADKLTRDQVLKFNEKAISSV